MHLKIVKETDGSKTYINPQSIAFIRNVDDGDCEIFFIGGSSILVEGEGDCQGIETDLV